MWIIRDIDWDVDVEEDREYLPTEVKLSNTEVEEERLDVDFENIIDYLSDKYEFCIKNVEEIREI